MTAPSDDRSRISRRVWLAVGLLALAAGAAWGGLRWFVLTAEEDPLAEAPLPPQFQRLVTLHERLGKPQPGDWLIEHPEFGQTYECYARGREHLMLDQRKVIYVQPLGEFSQAQREIIDRAAEFIGIYYQLPVRINDGLPLTPIPEEATRRRSDGTVQVRTGYILTEVLKPRVADDAAALVAFTTADLWPGEGWNRVYGEAMPSGRVGVWSIYCFGEPEKSDEEYRRVLRRTLLTGVHETGHLFGFQHCTFYNCAMCGSNHLGELDRHPLWLCPQCLAKLCLAAKADPAKRFRDLIAFAQRHELAREQAFWERSLGVLQKE